MEPIHLERSRGRTLGLMAIAFGFVALCAAMLTWRPRGLEAGSLKEFFLYAGIVLFGGGGLFAARNLFRTGPVVSVGPGGVFDRRISTDWLPWSAIRAVATAQMHSQSFLVLQLDPAQDGSLPIRPSARRLSGMNAAFGPPGYWMAATDLKGGFEALRGAVDRFCPEPDRRGPRERGAAAQPRRIRGGRGPV